MLCAEISSGLTGVTDMLVLVPSRPNQSARRVLTRTCAHHGGVVRCGRQLRGDFELGIKYMRGDLHST